MDYSFSLIYLHLRDVYVFHAVKVCSRYCHNLILMPNVLLKHQSKVWDR